ncbi:MAG: hypothetical protein FWG66_00950, partial [Spirochaetes bacterium]|nr:hypothetical protein [Spirochaetota bacterium]
MAEDLPPKKAPPPGNVKEFNSPSPTASTNPVGKPPSVAPAGAQKTAQTTPPAKESPPGNVKESNPPSPPAGANPAGKPPPT